MDKFCDSAQNSMLRGKLWTLVIVHKAYAQRQWRNMWTLSTTVINNWTQSTILSHS